MLSQFSSMLVALLLVIAGATVLVLIEITGKKGEGGQGGKKVRRVFGYLLFFLFALVVVLILNKSDGFGYQGVKPTWEIVHILLALLLLALILLKLFLIKLQGKARFRFIFTGLVLFGFIFILMGVTIGYYIFNPAGQHITSSMKMRWISRDTPSTQILMGRKCSKCHSLERIFLTYKEAREWQQTVERMAALDYPNITQLDVESITAYLIEQQQRREKSADRRKTGKTLVSRKCVICHDLARVYSADKTALEWEKTVDNMIALLGVSNFLSTQEKNDIITFLSSRQGSKMQIEYSSEKKMAEALVVRKCSAGCHALDRVLRVEKNPQEWRNTVESMEAITGDWNFLSEEEEEIIIDWLVHQKSSPEQDKVTGVSSSEDVHTLISSKCAACHDVEKLFQGHIKEGEASSGESRDRSETGS